MNARRILPSKMLWTASRHSDKSQQNPSPNRLSNYQLLMSCHPWCLAELNAWTVLQWTAFVVGSASRRQLRNCLPQVPLNNVDIIKTIRHGWNVTLHSRWFSDTMITWSLTLEYTSHITKCLGSHIPRAKARSCTNPKHLVKYLYKTVTNHAISV